MDNIFSIGTNLNNHMNRALLNDLLYEAAFATTEIIGVTTKDEFCSVEFKNEHGLGSIYFYPKKQKKPETIETNEKEEA